MVQQTLFEKGRKTWDRPPAVCVSTSIDAAERMADEAENLRDKIYQFLRNRPLGATRQEISDHFDLLIQTVCGRIGELKDRGLIWEGNLKRGGRRVVMVRRRVVIGER